MARICPVAYILFNYVQESSPKPKKRSLLNKYLVFLLFVPILSGSDRKDSEIPSTNVSFAGANFNVITNGESSIRYIWLHGDEKTEQQAHYTNKALKSILAKHGAQ